VELFYVYSGKMTRAVKQEKQNMSQTEIYPVKFPRTAKRISLGLDPLMTRFYILSFKINSTITKGHRKAA